jgi:NAD(P)-dependent dehydrogenase (short-subunit alcohol dehydrogenase family)
VELEGRTAVVTGPSRGLGREIAVRPASSGPRVVAIARDPDGLAAAVAGMPGSVTALPVDLADVDGIASAVDGVGDVPW